MKEHRLILAPQRFSQSTEIRTSLYYTKGEIVADTPSPNGVGITVFQIVGHTGYWGIRSGLTEANRTVTPEAFVETVQNVFTQVTTGQRAAGVTSYIDGAAAIKDFQDTILYYFDPAYIESVHEVQTQDLQLEFLNLNAPVSAEDQTGQVGWIIHPHRNMVDLQQDASKPFLYNYSFQFAAIARLATEVPDVFVERTSNPRTGFQETMRQITQTVTDLRNGVNTIEDAMTQMVIQNWTGPVSTFLESSAQLGDALGNFIDSTAAKIRFPLYAQRTAAHVLDAPKHSVTTLAEASKELGLLLISSADPRSFGRLLAGQEIIPGQNDLLTLALNDEEEQTITLPAATTGQVIAQSIQQQVRALTPQSEANAAAYRDFTATYDAATGQYQLSSGTQGSDDASVRVVTNADPDFDTGDASATLGLGLANGGQEQQGSAYPNRALSLLRGMEEACTRLQAYPDFFADQLDAQDAAIAALLPPGVTRPQIRGDQRMQQTRITPGDSLQGIAARVGVDWQTLALVNRLVYPYIVEGPSTLARGRVSSADYWSLTDVVQAWPTNTYQGQRVDILAGPGAGQSRRVLRNTQTQLVLEFAWDVVPNDTSDYAIRSAENPITRNGQVSSATPRTVTNGSLALVPDSQRGLTLVLTSGATAGERRQVTGNDRTTYTLDHPWDVMPAPGTLYLLLGPGPATRRQLVVGDQLKVPRPSAQTRLPIRSRLADVSAITGRHLSVEEQLFGRDLFLDPTTQSLGWDVTAGDLVTIAGLSNLKQALINYINLPLGELEYSPNIGSYVAEELALTATLPLQIQLLSSVERTIKQDARIASMQGAQLITQAGISVISFGATAVNGATLERITIR